MHLTTSILCLSLVLPNAAPSTLMWRQWLPVAADVSAMSDSKPQKFRVATSALCFAHASNHDARYNAACYKDNECQVATVERDLAFDNTSDWSCYQSPICFNGRGEQFTYMPLMDKSPPCDTVSYQGKCFMHGIRYQMLSNRVPELLETCSEPFTQEEFGCIFVGTERKVTACEARLFCNAIGGELASPRPSEKRVKLGEWLTTNYGKSGDEFWMGAFYRNGHWTYLRDGADVEKSDPAWERSEMGGGDSVKCARFKMHDGKYKLADKDCDTEYKFVCEVYL